MSATKPKSQWSEFERRAAALRRGLEAVVRELQSFTTSNIQDAISGDAILKTEVRAWEALSQRLVPVVRDVGAFVESEAARQTETFSQRLSRQLSNRGYAVHGTTSPLIVDGIVYVDVDVPQRKLFINGEPVSQFDCALLSERVDAEVQRLKAATTPPAKLLEQLLQAYETVVRSTNRDSGTQVEAAAVMLQLCMLRQRAKFLGDPRARYLIEYPFELFRSDLYALLSAGISTVKGKRFRYASGASTAGAVFMLVPALGRAAHLGRIWFEQAEG